MLSLCDINIVITKSTHGRHFDIAGVDMPIGVVTITANGISTVTTLISFTIAPAIAT